MDIDKIRRNQCEDQGFFKKEHMVEQRFLNSPHGIFRYGSAVRPTLATEFWDTRSVQAIHQYIAGYSHPAEGAKFVYLDSGLPFWHS